MPKTSFQSLVDILIPFNLLNRQKLLARTGKDSMDPVQYAKEFCTVSANIGRQTGKTHYFVDRVIENPDKEFLIVAMNDVVARGINGMIKRLSYSANNYKIVTTQDLRCMTRLFNPGDRMYTYVDEVFIDEPDMIKDKDVIYTTTVDSKREQLWIALG